MIRYKRDYPYLSASGDFSLLKRIILAEMRLDEMDEINMLTDMSEDDYGNPVPRFEPKTIDAFTRLHNQLERDIKTLGTTSRQKREEALSIAEFTINHQGLRQVDKRQEKVDDFIDSLPDPEVVAIEG
jgi:hypothetical protein